MLSGILDTLLLAVAGYLAPRAGRIVAWAVMILVAVGCAAGLWHMAGTLTRVLFVLLIVDDLAMFFDASGEFPGLPVLFPKKS